MRYDQRLADLDRMTNECRSSLQNHTRHIQLVKKDVNERALKTETRDITQHLKRFALYEDYETLYNKVVPPLKIVQDMVDKLSTDWQKTK